MEHVVTSADNGSGSAGFVVRALLHQRKVKEGNQTREIESSTKEKLRCVCVKGAGEKKREMAGCTPDCDECTWPLVAPRDQNVLGKEEKKKKTSWWSTKKGSESAHARGLFRDGSSSRVAKSSINLVVEGGGGIRSQPGMHAMPCLCHFECHDYGPTSHK